MKNDAWIDNYDDLFEKEPFFDYPSEDKENLSYMSNLNNNKENLKPTVVNNNQMAKKKPSQLS